MRFVDANVFIRYLTQDDPAKALASGVLFLKLLEEEDEAMTSESVVAELFYVLTSRRHYGLARDEAVARVRPSLLAPGLHLPHKGVVFRALDLYEAYAFLDFEDALSVAHMEARGISEIVSYDRGFDGVDGVVRVEP